MTNMNVSIGASGAFLALLIIYFWGDPDLHDLVVEAVYYLQQQRVK